MRRGPDVFIDRGETGRAAEFAGYALVEACGESMRPHVERFVRKVKTGSNAAEICTSNGTKLNMTVRQGQSKEVCDGAREIVSNGGIDLRVSTNSHGADEISQRHIMKFTRVLGHRYSSERGYPKGRPANIKVFLPRDPNAPREEGTP